MNRKKIKNNRAVKIVLTLGLITTICGLGLVTLKDQLVSQTSQLNHPQTSELSKQDTWKKYSHPSGFQIHVPLELQGRTGFDVIEEQSALYIASKPDLALVDIYTSNTQTPKQLLLSRYDGKTKAKFATYETSTLLGSQATKIRYDLGEPNEWMGRTEYLFADNQTSYVVISHHGNCNPNLCWEKRLEDHVIASIRTASMLAINTSNWKTYSNREYGFSFRYPQTHTPVADKAWPNALVLLYDNTQSYDFVVEMWESLDEYTTKYQNHQPGYLRTVREHNGKIFSLTNGNNQPLVDKIVETFIFQVL